MKHLILALLLLPAQASAQSALSAQEFDAMTRGKTFTYAENGQPYGAEEYLPDQRVRWSFLDGKCKEGRWWEEADGRICFVYEDNPVPQCWTFYDGAQGLTARFENDQSTPELYAVDRSDDPLMCLGPEVGV
jgi:hypothetical protein